MSLVNGNIILQKAKKGGYAVGAFNFSNMEQLKAILAAAQNKKSDVIVQTSKSAIEYMGLEIVVDMVKILSSKLDVDVCLNLDHGADFEICKQCIDAGYTNVMIDASSLPFEQNVELTKKVVEYAHARNVSVEAELGALKGIEDQVVASQSVFTNPEQAKLFVEQTKVDSLAVSIGTSHGAYKFKGESKLDIERLKQIEQQTKIPLVLHGASSVSKNLKDKFLQSGGQIGNANGVDNKSLADSIKNGVCKVNVDTDLRIAFTTGVREVLKDATIFDPRKYLKQAQKLMQQEVETKIDVLLLQNKQC